MVQNVEDILKVVIFIAVGGTLAIVFFFMFAQIILGSKSTHNQLKRLTDLCEQILNELKRNPPNNK